LTVKAAMNPAELRLWERNSTIVIFRAIRLWSILFISLFRYAFPAKKYGK
jgi:hypothetical protein